MGHLIKILILFFNVIHYKCNIFVRNWSNAVAICSALCNVDTDGLVL